LHEERRPEIYNAWIQGEDEKRLPIGNEMTKRTACEAEKKILAGPLKRVALERLRVYFQR